MLYSYSRDQFRPVKQINMQSKSTFYLDHHNNPVIKVEAVYTPDVRDSIARRFVEAFAHGNSQWCECLPTGENEYMIWPIKPEELRETAKKMILKAEELEKYTAATKTRIESL